MNISQLKCFLVSAKYLSFTKAAKVMFLTQSVVSRQIQSLEEEMGVSLFIRERKRIYLTPAGAVMYERLPHIHSSLESLISDIQAIENGSAGKLVIGMVEGHYLNDRLNPAVRWFTDRSSKLQLSLKQYNMKDLIPALYNSELDIAVTALSDVVTFPEINTYELETDKIFLCCRNNHPALQKKEPKLSDFRDDLFFSFPEETSKHMNGMIIRACKQDGFMPQIKTLSGMGEMFVWLEMGLGVAFVSKRCMLINNEKLTFLDLRNVPNPTVALAWHKDNSNQLIQAFVDELETEKTKKKTT